MASNVVGLFDTQEQAQQAVQNLIAAGFDSSTIGLVVADPGGSIRRETVDEEGSLAGEGLVTGAASGLIVGGLIGLLVGATTLVGGPVGIIAAGPIAGMVTGAGLGMVGGGLFGALVGLGIPSETAHVYAEAVRRGSILVSVSAAATDVQRAETILLNCGAVNIEERANSFRQSGWTEYDPKAPVYSAEEMAAERARYVVAPPVIAPSSDPIPPAPPAIATGIVQPATDDESAFRNHFLTNYPLTAGDYETFRPAYHYGYEFATQPTFSGMDWNTAEPQARTMWESRNPGTWDRFRDAIHHGWNRAGIPGTSRTIETNRAELI